MAPGPDLTPIRTKYAGTLFRSRLEARWAVFFDALDVKWEYEKEGYQLASGWYLPDFWLPSWGWVEIKGQEPTGQEQCLALELCGTTGKPVVIFPGSPLDLEDWGRLADPLPVVAIPDRTIPEPSAVWTGNPWLPNVCPQCRQMVIFDASYAPDFAHLDGSGWACSPGVRYLTRTYSGTAPELLRAISTVRSHRFWDPKKAA